MRSAIQQTLLSSLASVLRPIVKLLLRGGVGYTEFSSVAKSVFVAVASEQYGIRGRPTNMSRVSAVTGISRKEVSRLRQGHREGSGGDATRTIPANEVLHYWHHDRDFCSQAGSPNPLPFEGEISFSALVGRYAGDIPPGAIRASLRQAGALDEDERGLLAPRQRFFVATQIDEDFIRGVFFSLANLGNAVAHNAQLRAADEGHLRVDAGQLFLERSAWSDHIPAVSRRTFREWVHREGARFVDSADELLGEHEIPRRSCSREDQRLIGVGIYYFEEG